MIRTMAMLTFWALAMPFAAIAGFVWTFITGDISLLYNSFTWGAWAGVWLTGVRVEIKSRMWHPLQLDIGCFDPRQSDLGKSCSAGGRAAASSPPICRIPPGNPYVLQL